MCLPLRRGGTPLVQQTPSCSAALSTLPRGPSAGRAGVGGGKPLGPCPYVEGLRSVAGRSLSSEELCKSSHLGKWGGGGGGPPVFVVSLIYSAPGLVILNPKQISVWTVLFERAPASCSVCLAWFLYLLLNYTQTAGSAGESQETSF